MRPQGGTINRSLPFGAIITTMNTYSTNILNIVHNNDDLIYMVWIFHNDVIYISDLCSLICPFLSCIDIYLLRPLEVTQVMQFEGHSSDIPNFS